MIRWMNRTLYDDTVTSQSLIYGSTNNRLTAIASQSVTTDNNGNITSIHGMTLAYDAHNRLSSATVSSTTTNYVYNGLGERVTKQTGSNTRHYFYGAQQQLLAEYDGTGNVEREYIYLDGQLVVMLDHGGSGIDIYWIHNDHLGRPLALTDEAGDVVWRLNNTDAFGNAANIDEDPDNNSVDLVFNFRFPGQYFDSETGLHYNYFRDYDPKTGRYIESDPIGLNDGPNIYTYVGNNPINYFDINGEARQKCSKRVYQILRGTVIVTCKTPTSCGPGDSCNMLRLKIATKKLCIAAQEALSKACFPDDQTHKQRIDDENKGIKRCEDFKKKACCGEGTK